jgi:hypothetical protein
LFRRGEEDEEEGEVRKEQRDGHVDFKRLSKMNVTTAHAAE